MNRVIKVFLASLLFIFSTYEIYSFSVGAGSINIGPQVSLNYSQLTHDYSDGDKPSQEYSFSWGAGVNGQLNIRNFSFDLGLLYAQRVSKFSSSQKSIDLEYTFNQIEIPLVANYEISLLESTSLRMGFGAAYWLGLGDVIRDNSSLGSLSTGGKADSKSYDFLGIKNHQFVGIANLGLKLDLKVVGILVFDFRYHHPLTNRADAPNLKTIQNRSFDLSASYLF